jgi:CRP/FNR family transcriptional regulator
MAGTSVERHASRQQISTFESTDKSHGAETMYDPTPTQSMLAGRATSDGAQAFRLPKISARMSLAEVLKLLGHAAPASEVVEQAFFTTRRVHEGHTLVAAGQAFESLYLVLSGTFKSALQEANGTEQVVAFPMVGDLIGLDALCDGRFQSATIALEECNVVVLPYRDLMRCVRDCHTLEETLLRAFSEELQRRHRAMSTMGALGAEVRTARFLLQLSTRMERFGFSPRRFRLRMTRREIGSYLGLSVETVSRAFTTLANLGYIEVDQREIAIADMDGLKRAEEVTLRTNHFTLARRKAGMGAAAARAV